MSSHAAYQSTDVVADCDPLVGAVTSCHQSGSSRTRQAIDRHFAAWRLWMDVGSAAFRRYNQRRSRALISLGQIARILEIGFDFAHLVVPRAGAISDEEFSHAQALADLERSYGRPLPGEEEGDFSKLCHAPSNETASLYPGTPSP